MTVAKSDERRSAFRSDAREGDARAGRQSPRASGIAPRRAEEERADNAFLSASDDELGISLSAISSERS